MRIFASAFPGTIPAHSGHVPAGNAVVGRFFSNSCTSTESSAKHHQLRFVQRLYDNEQRSGIVILKIFAQQQERNQTGITGARLQYTIGLHELLPSHTFYIYINLKLYKIRSTFVSAQCNHHPSHPTNFSDFIHSSPLQPSLHRFTFSLVPFKHFCRSIFLYHHPPFTISIS